MQDLLLIKMLGPAGRGKGALFAPNGKTNLEKMNQHNCNLWKMGMFCPLFYIWDDHMQYATINGLINHLEKGQFQMLKQKWGRLGRLQGAKLFKKNWVK